MRISDSSSDVCSSDLPRYLPRHRPGDQGGRLYPRLPRGRGTEGRGMMLLTPDLHAALRANDAAARLENFDPVPVLKFFNHVCAATWLATGVAEDGERKAHV